MGPLIQKAKNISRRIVKDNLGAISVSSLTAVAYAILTPVVVLLLLAALAPTFFDSVASFGENITDVEFGSSSAANTGEAIVEVFAIIFFIVAPLALLTIAFFYLRAKKGG